MKILRTEKIVINKDAKPMNKKLSWIFWLILVIAWNYGFPEATPLQDVLVAVILSIIFITINKFLISSDE